MAKDKWFKDILSNKTKFKRFVILIGIVVGLILAIFIISRIGYSKKDGVSVEPVNMKVDVKVNKGIK